MRNKLFVTIAFSFITLSIQPAGKWKVFFEQYKPHLTTFNRIRAQKLREFADDEKKKKEKSAMPYRQPISRFQQAEKPKITFQGASSWRERLSKWWNSWFHS